MKLSRTFATTGRVLNQVRHDIEGRADIETLVELGRSMKMEVVAEGVETVEQVGYLKQKGVAEAQGYVFAPPLPATSYLALVEAMERPKPGAVPAQVALAGAV